VSTRCTGALRATPAHDPAEEIALVARARREYLLRAHRHQLRWIIAGLRLDTSHNGTDVGPNRAQDGPRWRLLEHLPSWAHWTIRHPPGL
jgi:hypothetical protein